MWIFTREGFFSIVKKDCEDDQLLVRARVQGDLEKILSPIEKVGYGPFEVIKVEHADYRYRVTLPAWMVSDYLAATAEGIDYDNFKNSLPHDANYPERSSAYMDVWSDLREFQQKIVKKLRW